MNLVPLEEWPVERPHGKAVTRIIHVSMEFEDFVWKRNRKILIAVNCDV